MSQIPAFNSYPLVSFKKLNDGDTIAQFREKTQFNFDQIYLNFVNKVLKGEKGDTGYTGLSIKGDKGEKGDVGSLIWFENVVDNQPISNPDHALGDVIVSDNGSYFQVEEDLLGGLYYSLQFVLPSNSLFITQTDFALLGGITAHQIYDATTDANVLLGSRIGSEARYRRMILGDNVYSSATSDTLTLVNLLDGANAGSSTPQKQLRLRYRDTNNGSISATSFDFKYYVTSGIEYKTIGDNISNISITKDTVTGDSKTIINTTLWYFTAGISNFETSDGTNSIIVSKSGTVWRMRQPDLEDMTFGFYDRLVLSGDRIGYNTASPTRDIDLHGQYIIGEDDPSILGSYLAYLKSDPTYSEIGWKTHSVRISNGQIKQTVDANTYAILSGGLTDIKNTYGRLLMLSSGVSLRSGNTILSMDTGGAYLASGANTSNQVLVTGTSSSLIAVWGSLTISNTQARIIHGGIPYDFKANGFYAGVIRGYTDDLDLYPSGASGTVSLKTRVAVVNQSFTANVDSVNASGTKYVIDYDGTLSATDTALYSTNKDTLIYASHRAGGGTIEVYSGANLLGIVGLNGCGSFIIPAGTPAKIVFVGAVTAKLTFGGFGV